MFIQIIFLWIISSTNVYIMADQLILPKDIMKCLKKQAISFNILIGAAEKNILFATRQKGQILVDTYKKLLNQENISPKPISEEVLSELNNFITNKVSFYDLDGEKRSDWVAYHRAEVAYYIYFVAIYKLEVSKTTLLFIYNSLNKLFTNLQKPSYVEKVFLLFKKTFE